MSVPVLRFSEFQGDWEEKRLGRVAKFRRGSFPQPYGLPEWYDAENGTPFVQVFDVGNDFKLKPETKQKISKLAQPKSVFVEAGSIVLTIQGSIGRIALTQYDAFVDRTLLIFNAFLEPFDKAFFVNIIFLLFEQEKRKAPGGTIKTITKEALSSFKFISPTLPEQKKIAAFLGVVDDKLAALTSKRDLLGEYKRGLMQKLFSQELRFTKPNGQPFPDWEEKRLGDVLTIGSGRDYKHLPNGNIPVYGTGGYMTSVSDYLYDGESVCIGRKGTIDKPVLLTGKFWTVDTLFYTHEFKGVLPYFIYSIFQRINWKRHSEASGVPSLSKSTIEKLKVPVPHPDEQQKIADALSALDDKISAVADQITAMQDFKKGLLQQMFV